MTTMALLLVAVILLLQRQIFILPIIRLTDWFKKFQSGEIAYGQSIQDKDEFGRLMSEVEQVALSLRIAKKAANDEASKRTKKE